MRHGLYKVDLENDVTVYEPNKGDGENTGIYQVDEMRRIVSEASDGGTSRQGFGR